jgi:hypothetical protein
VQDLGHAGFEDVLGLLGLLGGEGHHVPALRGDVDGALVVEDAVDERRRAELDLVLIK